MRTIIFRLSFIYFQLFAISKVFCFDVIDKNNGLRTNCIHSVVEHEGLIYIFTKFGIERWDGFRVSKISMPSELKFSEILHAEKDKFGVIWFATVNGFIGKITDNKVVLLKKNNRVYQTSSWPISVSQGSEGSKYILYYSRKLVRVDSSGVIHELDTGPLRSFSSNVYIKSRDEIEFFSSDCKFTVTGNSIRTDSVFGGFFPITSALTLQDNIYIILKSDSVFQYSSASKRKTLVRKGIRNNCKVFNDSNFLFLTDSSELYVYESRAGGYSLIDSLSVNDVSSVKLSNDGSILVSTLNQGLIVYRKNNVRFLFPYGSGNPVLSVSIPSKKHVFVGGFYGNLGCFDLSNNYHEISISKKLYRYGLGRIFRALPFNGKYLVCYEQRGFILDEDLVSGKVLSFGLRNFSTQGGKFLFSSSRDIHFMNSDKFSRVIVGDFNSKILDFENVFVDISSSSKAPFLRPYSFCRFGDSTIIGSDKGLYLFSGSNLSKLIVSKSSQVNQVKDVTRLSGPFFVASIDDFFIKVFSITTQAATLELSMLNSVINRLVGFSKNSVWLCTDDGLYLCTFSNSYKNYKLRRFSTRDGLLSNEVNDIAFARGKWWVATSKGLCLLEPDFYKVREEAAPRPTHHAFLLNGRSADSLPDRELVGIARIAFSFGCLSFRHMGNLRFRYRLSPSSAWILTDKADHELNSLSPGDYRIEVQSCTPNSPWSASLFYPEFRILAPFWQRTWVIISASALLFSMVFALFYNVQRIRIARLQLESEMTDASLKSIRTQMKPHFLSNILNSMHYFILTEKPEDSGNFVSSFSRLVRHMLDSSDKNYLPLHPELFQLREYFNFECKRMNRDVALNIHFQKDADFSNVMIPAMLLQPLIENSLMHGIFPVRDRDGVIDIFISKVESGKFRKIESDRMRVSWKGRLLIKVKDNGQGRAASMAVRHRRFSHSYGMRGIADRLLWIKKKFSIPALMEIQDLKDSQGTATGTVVVLNLPLMESAAKSLA